MVIRSCRHCSSCLPDTRANNTDVKHALGADDDAVHAHDSESERAYHDTLYLRYKDRRAIVGKCGNPYGTLSYSLLARLFGVQLMPHTILVEGKRYFDPAPHSLHLDPNGGSRVDAFNRQG